MIAIRAGYELLPLAFSARRPRLCGYAADERTSLPRTASFLAVDSPGT